MTKEKLESLNKYLVSLENKLKEEIPNKHKHRPEHYIRFLKNEQDAVKSTIEKAKLEGVGK